MDQRSIIHYNHFLENINRITRSDNVYDLDFMRHPLSEMSKFQLMYYNKTKEYYEMAIEDIYKAADNCSSAVIIKGYVEDSDLYPDYFRPYSDIDVLVSRNEIFSFTEKLADLGYSFADAKLTKEEVDLQLRLMPDQPHISRVFKKYGNITICSEIHVSLKGSWNQLAEYENIDLTSVVMTDAENVDSKFSRMSSIDRFIFGLEHFGKHVVTYFEHAWLRDSEFQIPLHFKSLFDSIAVFYQYDLIHEDKIYDRIEKLGFSHEIRIANLFLRELFEFNHLDDNRLISCKNYNINDSERIVADYICNSITIPALLNCTELTQGAKYIEYALSRSVSATMKNGVVDLVIDGNHDSITKRKYGSILKYPLLSKRKTHCSAKVKMSVDENYLKIAACVIDDCVKISGDGQPNAWGESMNVFIYNPHFAELHTFPLTGFFISPKYRNDSLTINICYNNAWYDERGNKAIDEKDIPHKVTVTDSGYSLEVYIGWELLGIIPSELDYLGADFIINDVDSDDPEIDTVMSWSNPTVYAHNPARYGIIKFKNATATSDFLSK